ncbi:TnsA endonuclease N-terminal domain-containing protein [Bosea sp. R86505]|uniref:TnsA endonuclease N-terminal domain-containing protein n=1 Tax=Bosea sp. R86505 TaxID=3101710 RepID=UPI00366A783B
MKNPLPASPAPIWRPPGPSMASREVHSSSRGACRPSLVGGTVPREIRCESGLERKAGLALLTHPQVADLQEQPPSVAWKDAAGHPHRHTFDFLAFLHDRRKLAVAVKPKAIADKRFADQLAMIAKQLPRSFADGVLLLTEQDLPRDLIHNATLVHQSRRVVDVDLDRQLLSLVGDNPGVTIGQLVKASGRGGDAFRSIVRLIGSGPIVTVRRQMI